MTPDTCRDSFSQGDFDDFGHAHEAFLDLGGDLADHAAGDFFALVLFEGLEAGLFDFAADLLHAGLKVAAGDKFTDDAGEVHVHDSRFHLLPSQEKEKKCDHCTGDDAGDSAGDQGDAAAAA